MTQNSGSLIQQAFIQTWDAASRGKYLGSGRHGSGRIHKRAECVLEVLEDGGEWAKEAGGRGDAI